MAKFFTFLKNLLIVIFTLGKKGSISKTVGEKVGDGEPSTPDKSGPWPPTEDKPAPPRPPQWSKEQLLKPILHRRYISLYCIADLEDGGVPITTTRGNEIWRISAHSRKRLNMEGTGRLSNGKVVNVAKVVNGSWSYTTMGPDSPHGVGIRGKALKPWFSMAHHLQQLRTHSLFGRKIVIPELKGYNTPDGFILDGEFEVHDTGGGLRKCPYERGLWRTGSTKSKYGQFDLFIGGPESMYKGLLGSWKSYFEVIVMPRDTETEKGVQETLNLLLDSGLKVDGVIGPKTNEAITQLKEKAGLGCDDEEWCEDVKKYAELCLENW